MLPNSQEQGVMEKGLEEAFPWHECGNTMQILFLLEMGTHEDRRIHFCYFSKKPFFKKIILHNVSITLVGSTISQISLNNFNASTQKKWIYLQKH